MRLGAYLQFAGCVVAGAMLAACGMLDSLPTKKVEYQSAGKLPSLEVPPDLTRPTADDRYNVPDARKGTVSASQMRMDQELGKANPQSSLVLPEASDARIERSGTQRWLVVKGDPATVWPMVKDFWQETGLLLNTENAEAGVMETDWAENRPNVADGLLRKFLGSMLDSVYSTATRDKFRSRLEQGANGTTEIYISHRGLEETYVAEGKDQTRWQPRKPDPDLEAEMLRRLMVRFGVQQERVKQQVAQSAEAASRGPAVTRSGSMLMVNEQFDRAWRRVGLALDRVGFTVEDRDRSKGIYFVRYIDPEGSTAKPAEDKRGLFTRMADGMKFWEKSDIKKSEQYQISVRDMEATAQVSVLSKEGREDKSPTAGRILNLLFDQLK